MGTVHDNPGIKRFGKPHIHALRPSGYWTYVGTTCQDRNGRERNRAAANWCDWANWWNTGDRRDLTW